MIRPAFTQSYAVTRMILDTGLALEAVAVAVEALSALKPAQLAQELEVGQATIVDIEGLKASLHDIRDAGPSTDLREDVMSLNDLEVGMQLQGVVRNVVISVPLWISGSTDDDSYF